MAYRSFRYRKQKIYPLERRRILPIGKKRLKKTK